MKKEDIFSKLYIKDYNNQLEKILENKNFSEEVKNLLLSMFYKIEVAYNDYSKIKADSKAKNEFIEEILETIKNNCNSIKFVEPFSKESKKKLYINYESKEITCYPNEITLLYALQKIKNNYKNTENIDIIEKCTKFILLEGKSINAKEVLRDFDGWSWNINVDEIEDININFVYQLKNILLDEKSNIEEISKQYSKQNAEEFLKNAYKICVEIKRNDDGYKDDIINEYNIVKEKLEKMEDKVNYIKNLADEKKNAQELIKNIDKQLNNMLLLKKEYIKRNEKLPNEEKIFSMSDLSEILENERTEYVEKIKEYNNMLKPKFFVERKQKIENRKQILEEGTNIKDLKYDICNCTINLLEEKISNLEIKKEIVSIIYKIRYFQNLIIENKKNVNLKFKKQIDKLKAEIIKKAVNQKILNPVSTLIKENSKIISNILDTKIIDLEKIELELQKTHEKFILNIYDENTLEKTLEYDNIEECTLKQNKKVKLFV